MPLLNKGVAALANRMPKIISPKGHAIIDYVSIGTFGALAGMLWSRNRRAAVGALICGGAELTTVLLTDMPGGITDKISFPTHVKMDYTLAAAATALPGALGLEGKPEAKWFRLLGVNITAVAVLTETGHLRSARRRRRAA